MDYPYTTRSRRQQMNGSDQCFKPSNIFACRLPELIFLYSQAQKILITGKLLFFGYSMYQMTILAFKFPVIMCVIY